MNLDEIQNITVVGAGAMGHGIAQVFARAGYAVRLMDPDRAVLDKAQAQIRASLHTLARAGQVAHNDIDMIAGNIRCHTDFPRAFENTHFVVEAVPEIPEIKTEVFTRIDAHCSPGAIFATNTSGLDVFSLVKVSNPSRVIAAHFFAPAQIIPLVEVCPGPETSPEVAAITVGLMEKIGKEPVLMKKFVQSYIVNRIQNYISMAVFEILNNGWAEPEEIDRAVKASLGIRLPVVGVVQSLDFTGLDLVHDIMKSKGLTMPVIADRVARGDLGVKTSRGFYDYNGRSEEQVIEKRDILYLNLLNHLNDIRAFDTL